MSSPPPTIRRRSSAAAVIDLTGPARLPAAGTTEGPARLRVHHPKILLVEDNAAHAGLVRAWLDEQPDAAFDFHHVGRMVDACDHLEEHRADVVLLDLTLPDARGLEALTGILAASPDIAVVVLSGLDDERLAITAVRQGAQDYLVKSRVDAAALWRALRYAMERKQAELATSHHALHDPLTGLANRSIFVDRVQLALGRLERHRSSVAILFADLDRFKVVNDSLGHDVGDKLLVEVARRLQRVLRPTDSAARLGGDEFVVLCEDLCSDHDALAVAERIQGALAVPVVIDGVELPVTASIGAASASSHTVRVAALIADADAAMYRAKQRGGARCELYDAQMRREAEARREIESDLQGAVHRRDFEVHYQAVVELKTGLVIGAEALVRWRRPNRGLVTPDEFMDVAEESGLVVPLGELVLETAIAQAASWCATHAPLRSFPLMSINLSARQLIDPMLVDVLERNLTAAGVDPAALCIEVTESTLLYAEAASLAALHDLKDLGLRLCIDDFGTGYSSLTHLHRFRFDALKIHRSFVAGLGTEAADTAIVRAVLDLGRALDLTVVAEGVERSAQAEQLRALGCRLAQGFWFAPPGPHTVVGQLLGRPVMRPTS